MDKNEELEMGLLSEELLECLGEDFIKRSKKQNEQNEICNVLLRSYGLGIYDENGNIVGKVNLTSEDYPDYYAGSYLDESDDLVIMVTGSLDVAKKELEKVLSNYEYKISYVENSYKKLTLILEAIDEHFFKDSDEPYDNKGVYAYGILEKENRIFVDLADFDELAIKRFKETIDNSSLIEFREGIKAEELATVRPGGPVESPSGGSSIGYRVRRNGVDGFLMSAHAIGINQDASIGRTVVGRITARVLAGSVDAAFCRAGSNTTPSRTLHQERNITVSSTIQQTVITTMVLRAGRHGTSGGSITATGVRETSLSPPLSNLVRTTAIAYRGDSGGIFARLVGLEMRPLGILTRGVPGGSRSYYCTAANINSSLGTVLY